MCVYSYNKHIDCGHLSIETASLCAPVLWRAGMDGFITLCIPEALVPSREWTGVPEEEPPRSISFTAFSGNCIMCLLLKNLPLESQQRVMEHDEVVCSSPGEFDPHNPALYFGRLYLTATVPQLLGLLEQYRSKDKDLGPMMEFDNNGEYLSWAAIRERLPLKVECHFQQENHEMASLTVKEIQQRLGCTGGLIEEDRAFIEQSALMTFSPPDPDCRRGYDLFFKYRGMPFQRWTDYLRYYRSKKLALPKPPQSHEQQLGQQASNGDRSIVLGHSVVYNEDEAFSDQSRDQIVPVEGSTANTVFDAQSSLDQQNSFEQQFTPHDQSKSTMTPETYAAPGTIDAVEAGNGWVNKYYQRNFAPRNAQSSPAHSRKSSQASSPTKSTTAQSLPGLSNEGVFSGPVTPGEPFAVGGAMSVPDEEAQFQGMNELGPNDNNVQGAYQFDLMFAPNNTQGMQSSNGGDGLGTKRTFDQTEMEPQWDGMAGEFPAQATSVQAAQPHQPNSMSWPAPQAGSHDSGFGQYPMAGMTMQFNDDNFINFTPNHPVAASNTGEGIDFSSPTQHQPRPTKKQRSRAAKTKQSARSQPWDGIKPQVIDKVAYLNAAQKQQVKAELELHWATLKDAPPGSQAQSRCQNAIDAVGRRLTAMIKAKTRVAERQIGENEAVPDPGFSSPPAFSQQQLSLGSQQPLFMDPQLQMTFDPQQQMLTDPQQGGLMDPQQQQTLTPQQTVPTQQQQTLPGTNQLDEALNNFVAMASRFGQ